MKLTSEEKKVICDFFELMFTKIEEITDKEAPSPQDPAKPQNRLIPITHWNKYHEWPTIAGLRWLIFTNKKGFDECIRRTGRRVFINETAFFEWLNKK